MLATLKLLFLLSFLANLIGVALGIDVIAWMWGISAMLGGTSYRMWMRELGSTSGDLPRTGRGFGQRNPQYHEPKRSARDRRQ